MRIAEVRLSNFRRFKSGRVELAPMTVVTGPNGAGKSTILEAIRFVLEPLDRRGNDWNYYDLANEDYRSPEAAAPGYVSASLRCIDLTEDELVVWGPAVRQDGSVLLGALESISDPLPGDDGQIMEHEFWGYTGLMLAVEQNQLPARGGPTSFPHDGESWVWPAEFSEWHQAFDSRYLPTIVSLGGPDHPPPTVGEVLSPIFNQAMERIISESADDVFGPVGAAYESIVASANKTLGKSVSRYLPTVTTAELFAYRSPKALMQGITDAVMANSALRLVMEPTHDILMGWDGIDDSGAVPGGGTYRAAVLSCLELYRDPDLWPADRLVILAIEEPEIGLDAAAQRRLGSALRELPSFGLQAVVVSHSPTLADAAGWDGVRLVRPIPGTTESQVSGRPHRSDVAVALGVSPADALLARRFLLVEGASDALALEAWSSTLGMSLAAAGVRTHAVGGMSMATAVASFVSLAYETAHVAVVLDRDETSRKQKLELEARFEDRVVVTELARTQLEAYFSLPAVQQWLEVNGVETNAAVAAAESLGVSGATKKALFLIGRRLLQREYRVPEDGFAIASFMSEAEIAPEIKGLLTSLLAG